MKKLTIFSAIALLALLGATTSHADYKDIADEVGTIAKVWVGGSARESDKSVSNAFADRNATTLPEAAGRVGTAKAAEFYSDENSPSGGLFYKTAYLPQRIHLEFDYFNANEWYGDFRYSYLDYVQVRLLPRRFYHNLDNLTVYDFAPGISVTPPLLQETSEIEINDQGVEDYGLRTDINKFQLRFKTPGFPFHLYGEGESVRRKGSQQARFLGGSAFFGPVPGINLVRVTESRAIDQENQDFILGTNAHLGLIEIDITHKNRKFESDIADPTYNYTGAGNSVHNVTPELKATVNTLKMHTSHSGRVFASVTLSELNKENEYSGAEAKNTLSNGEVFWLPASYLAFTTKFRHQVNKASAPATVTATNWLGGPTTYLINPGVESETDTASLGMRFSLIPKTNLNLKYTKKIKKVEDQSSLAWSSPPKTTKDEYELSLSNWVIPKVRATAKVNHIRVATELATTSINNEPDQTNQFNLGVTWLLTPKIVAYGNSYVAREETESNQISGVIGAANVAEALRQQHLLSVSFMVNDKLTLSPTYTYIADEQGRDMIWDGVVDSNYTNKQEAHNYALQMMYLPSKEVNLNCSIDYTTTDGSYDPTSPFSGTSGTIDTAEIAQFSQSTTEEINLRLDADYDIGRGWGVGLDLRYTDWQDDSFDNPSEGEFVSGLLKITKVM
ncbi:MAG: hypothetical protein ABFS18_05470 [Thermodesulfobacteriota bacterium]